MDPSSPQSTLRKLTSSSSPTEDSASPQFTSRPLTPSENSPESASTRTQDDRAWERRSRSVERTGSQEFIVASRRSASQPLRMREPTSVDSKWIVELRPIESLGAIEPHISITKPFSERRSALRRFQACCESSTATELSIATVSHIDVRKALSVQVSIKNLVQHKSPTARDIRPNLLWNSSNRRSISQRVSNSPKGRPISSPTAPEKVVLSPTDATAEWLARRRASLSMRGHP